jgi:hypothetical protein
MNHLWLKLSLAPLFVVGASLAGRKWGHRVSGWLSGFPIVAGPILYFFALEQGLPFAAQAAQKTLLGLVAFGAFIFTFAWASRRWHAGPSVLAGWAAFMAVDSLMLNLKAALLPSFGLAVGGLGAVGFLLPSGPVSGDRPPAPRWLDAADIPLRMAATALLVLSLTGTAKALGPSWSGVLTPFPVATSVLAGFAHLKGGPAAASKFLGGSLAGMFGFSSFCAVLSCTLVPWGLAGGFLAASLTVLLVQMVVMRSLSWRSHAA